MLEGLDDVLDVRGLNKQEHECVIRDIMTISHNSLISKGKLMHGVEFNRSLCTTQLWWFNFLDYQSDL